jgi:ABC-type transport system involved in multi-copper enzyme maturation permease subunit
MLKQIRTIAYYTLLEALRNRLTWLIVVIALAGIGLTGFLNELALTENREIQLALLASFLRFSGVFLLATFVVTSMVREANDKGLQLVLALPLPRAGYLFGKLAGFATLAMILAVLFGLLVAVLASPQQALLWTISLIFECWIVAAFSMLCVFTFNQVVSALSSVMGFYLLARSIAALQLIGNQPLIEHTPSQRIINVMIDCLSAVLPHLDMFTRTDWLVYNTGNWSAIGLLIGQSCIYLALLCGAALFDLYRKNI